MAEQSFEDQEKAEEQAWLAANPCVSYSQAFEIRKVMYRIQDMDLPFKRGIRTEQFLIFIVVAVLMFIGYEVIIDGILGLLGVHLPFQFLLLYFVGPPVLASIRIGKPMPHNKTISGMFMSKLRYLCDDPWHKRGMPVRHAPYDGLEENYARMWYVDPDYAGIESASDKPSSELLHYVHQELPDEAPDFEEKTERESVFESSTDFGDRIFKVDSQTENQDSR